MDSREAEFGRLFAAHRGALHAYLAGRAGDRQLAADLTQDVFLRAWEHLDTLRGLSADGQRGWLFTVARNRSVDAHRTGQTRAGTEQALAREPSREPAPASAGVLAAERVSVVGEAIRRLPEPQRVALTLAAAGDLTSAEIGAALGLPPGTVRYRLSEARRALAAALSDYDDPRES